MRTKTFGYLNVNVLGMEGIMKTIRKQTIASALTFALCISTALSCGEPAGAKAGKKVKKVAITSPVLGKVYLKKGQSYKLKVKVTPKKAKNKKLRYQSSKPKVAAVSKKGKIKAKKAGTAKITVTARDGSKKKARLTVKVLKKFKKASSVALNKNKVTLYVNGKENEKTVSLLAKVKPVKATVKKVVYRSSNNKIASVSKKGKITAIKEGTAKITAYAEDGRGAKAVCQVTVAKKSDNNSSQTPNTPAKVNCLQFRGVNNFMSYTVVRYLLPNGVKVSDLTGIQFDAETKKDTSIRFYAGEARDEKTELTSAKQEVKDTVTGTATAVVDNTTVPKTTHKLEITTTETTRPLLKSGAKQTIFFPLDATAKERLQGEKENEVAFVVYPHAAKPQMTFYNLKLRTTMATYDVPLHTDNWMAGYGGILTFV